MGVSESEWLRHSRPHPQGETRFRRLAILSACLFLGYVAATAAGAPRQTSSLIFSVVVMPLPFVVWWAYVRAPADVRPMVLYCAWAATLWFAGSLVWYGFFLASGSQIPPSPGVWDIFFVAARLLLIAAVWVAMRSLISVKIAVLDAVVIVAAGIALGAAFIGHGLEKDTSLATFATLNRPVLSVITLMLIASAALASLDGLRRSIVLLGAGEIALTIGSLLYSYAAVQGQYVDDRYANLAWAAGAGLSMLAAAAVILRVDTPIGPALRQRRLPGHPAGARNVILVTLIAAAVSVAVGLYGLLDNHRTVGLIGLVSTAVIAVAIGLRGRDAIASAEHTSTELDEALARSERDRDQLRAANAELQQHLRELRTLRVAAARWLNLVDERNDGLLRDLVERAGRDVQALAEEHSDERGWPLDEA